MACKFSWTGGELNDAEISSCDKTSEVVRRRIPSGENRQMLRDECRGGIGVFQPIPAGTSLLHRSQRESAGR